ncbi:MAG: hypothetical protein LAP87_11795 [Acidobacteriia bacterium]|nr:hypothetical protein [Terriglobia bacterium]
MFGAAQGMGGTAHSLDNPAIATACGDAFLTARLWQKMIHVLQAVSAGTLGTVLRFARS